MAAENPPSDPNPALSKKATVRITLPPKPASGSGPEVKKETVRITLPQPPLHQSAPPAPMAPPSELPGLGSPSKAFIPPPPSAAKSPLPPPPSMLSGPPRPPGPLTPPVAPGKLTPPPPAIAVGGPILKPGSPKKETTRIQVPPEPKVMPKATVKLQPTAQAPMAPIPVAEIKTVTDEGVDEPEKDSLLIPSIIAAVVSVVALALGILAAMA